MRMFRACIDFYIIHKNASKTSVRKHSLYCKADRIFRMLFNEFFKCMSLETSYITGCIFVVNLFLFFSTGNGNFISIDNYYVITHFLIRSIGRLFFTANNRSSFCSYTSKWFTSSVDDKPVALLFFFIYENSFHVYTLKIIKFNASAALHQTASAEESDEQSDSSFIYGVYYCTFFTKKSQ